MEPATRTLLQVNIDDAVEAERVVSELMGEQVEPRKEFIRNTARDVRFLVFRRAKWLITLTNSTTTATR